MRKRMTGGLLAAVAATALGAAAQPVAAADPVQVGEAFGVRIEPQGRTMTITFPRRARKELAGRVISVTCERRNSGRVWSARVPRKSLRVRMRNLTRGASSCEIMLRPRGRGQRDRPAWDGERIVNVPLTEAAVTRIDEEVRGQLLWFPFITPSDDDRGFPTAAEMLRGLTSDRGMPYRFVALASPDDTPSGNEIGYWSNGRDHAIAVTRSVAGRRLFVEILPGDELRTNVIGTLFAAESSL